MSDLISVIIPTYNNGQYIEEALNSVLTQDYAPIEVIIVDDGSTDNTRNIVGPYLGENVRYFYQENKGHGAARNFGIRQARGAYIAQLDADDYYLPRKLSIQMEYLKTHPDCRIVFTSYQNFYANEREHELALRVNPAHTVPLSHATMLAQRKLFDDIGYFDEHHRVAPDLYWMHRLSLVHKIPIIILEDILLMRRCHLDSLSHRLFAQKTRALLEYRCSLLRALRAEKK